ncbi:MAG: hypothetical protein ACLP2X_09755, partial [Syntrophobacteraceae bacterium]
TQKVHHRASSQQTDDVLSHLAGTRLPDEPIFLYRLTSVSNDATMGDAKKEVLHENEHLWTWKNPC